MDLAQLKRAHVLVTGDAMLDRYWFGDAERISPEAPVPVVRVTRTEERCGKCRAQHSYCRGIVNASFCSRQRRSRTKHRKTSACRRHPA